MSARAGAGLAANPSILAAVLALAGACAPVAPAATPRPATEIRPGVLRGWLAKASLPNSLKILPPPPLPGSGRMAADWAVNRAARRLRGTARWNLARRDAVLALPASVDAFTCAAGIRITKDQTPNLYRVLGRAETDARLSTHRAKKHYRRRRPFLLNGKPICTPGAAKDLGTEGSFPSGHSTVGWTWALLLAELIPDRANRILVRGRQFGESRLVCNVHWNSDVEAGRMLGAAVVARLHGDPRVQEGDARGAPRDRSRAASEPGGWRGLQAGSRLARTDPIVWALTVRRADRQRSWRVPAARPRLTPVTPNCKLRATENGDGVPRNRPPGLMTPTARRDGGRGLSGAARGRLFVCRDRARQCLGRPSPSGWHGKERGSGA